MKPEARLKAWQANKPVEAACDDVLEVLRHLGFSLRRGGKHHWIATNEKLVGHPLFPNGVITMSCHNRGKSGSAHPSAIRDVLKAAKFLAEEK